MKLLVAKVQTRLKDCSLKFLHQFLSVDLLRILFKASDGSTPEKPLSGELRDEAK
jgi:hypothetical protein